VTVLPCPTCRDAALSVGLVYDSGSGQTFFEERCGRCGMTRRRKMTTFEQVSLTVPRGLYASVSSAADLRSLAPMPGSCVFCEHTWALHASGSCRGPRVVRLDEDTWTTQACGCSRKESP